MPRSWDRTKVVRPEAVRERDRKNWRAWAERQHLAGLTTRATTPKRRLEGRIILAELDALAVSIAEVYEWLPAQGKAHCIRLASRLADIRRRLT